MKSYGKKIFTICLTTILLCTNTFAALADNTKYADTLYSFGLFKGTDNGYELEKTLTREESATILVRLLGEESNLKASNYTAVFNDVTKERWSFPYVMFCYKNEITKGTSSDTFSPSSAVTARQFTALVLRLMGYADIEPENALEESVYKGIINTDTARRLKSTNLFARDDMVYIVYRSLMCKTSDGRILADILAEKGVVTEKEVAQFNVYESTDNIDELLEKLLG